MASKYEPLTAFLSAALSDEVVLNLDQVRVLVPGLAPSAALDSRWWANNDASHSHCKSWAAAGFSAHPNLARGRVTFRRFPVTQAA